MADEFSRSDVTLSNWRTRPYNRWSFQNVAEIVPSATIAEPTGTEPPSPGPGLLADMMLDNGGERVSAVAHLENSFADSFVAMRGGEIIAEWHAGHVDAEKPHIIFSISKSITGMLAGIAAGEGLLDPDAPVSDYVAVGKDRAYGQAKVCHLLDMTVSLDFDEAYLDAGGAFDRYRRAMLWNPEDGGSPFETMEPFLCSLAPGGPPHGARLHYASPNTDMLGLVVERATGIRYHDYLADRLWKPMGARGAARVTVDRTGAARAAGGVCVTARDLARLGDLVMNDGKTAAGAQIIPADWIADMRANGDRDAWVNGDFAEMFANGRYRSCWYATGDERDSFCGAGIHEQWLWVDPTGCVVLSRMSSRNEPSDDATSAREIKMLGQIARQLAH